MPSCTSNSFHKENAEADQLRVGQWFKNNIRWENDRCQSICLDGVWLGAPGLADGSGLEFGGAAVFARTLLSLTHQVTTLPLPAPSSPASHQRMFYSFRLSRELPAPYLLLEPKFIAALNHPQYLHNASPPAPTLAASFFELTIHHHLCTFLQRNGQGGNGIMAIGYAKLVKRSFVQKKVIKVIQNLYQTPFAYFSIYLFVSGTMAVAL